MGDSEGKPVCGCAGSQARPLHAVGVEADLKAANLRHLKRIEGQVRGIASMIEEDRYCADIIVQVAAARESLASVSRNLLRNHLTHCAAKAMSGTDEDRARMIEEILELTTKASR